MSHKRAERSELVELRDQVERALDGRVGAWWDGVVALRAGPPTLENLVKALEKLRGAPPLVLVTKNDDRTAASITALRFVERALLNREVRTKPDLVRVLNGLVEKEEVEAALVALVGRGEEAALRISRNEKAPAES